MKKLLADSLFARNSKFDFAFIALILVAFVIGCGGSGGSSSSTPKQAIPAAYLGTWTGTDGTTISIRNDNTGDYKAGSSKVDGAAVEVDGAGKEIKFTLLGVDVGKYKIDKAAAGGSMTLNGMVFKKTGGSTVSAPNGSDAKTIDDSSGGGDDVPSKDELDALVAQTMEDFNSAVQSDDFTDFHSHISELWQKQITADKLQETFAPFAKQKVDLTPKTGTTPTYSPQPSFDQNEMLVVEGKYTTVKGKTPQFKLTYAKENSDWKLFGIRVVP